MSDQKTRQKPDHEKRIREALEAGPTEGPFQVVRGGTYCWDIKTTDSYDVATTHGYVRNQVDSLPTANFIAACNPSALRALLADLDEPRAALSAAKAGGWQPIETAPRGSGIDGPDSVSHPDYVCPPKLLLWTEEGPLVGYYDWYYHPGYGRGAEDGESAWRDHNGDRTYGATHWQPLPAPPAQRGEG